MNRAFFRFLARSLLGLLAVTLPLQGFASAMRSCCVDELAVVATVAVEAMQAPPCHDMADMQMADQPMKMAWTMAAPRTTATIAATTARAPWAPRRRRACTPCTP